jgi:hypothetical protein
MLGLAGIFDPVRAQKLLLFASLWHRLILGQCHILFLSHPPTNSKGSQLLQ